jgi:myo-inositol-1(or 4)-monophosphatase
MSTAALTPADLDARFAVAVDLVREAGLLAVSMRNQAGSLSVATKGVRDFATAADTAVERLIVARLSERFSDAVLGEEFGGATTASTLWIVDPIDGTYNFMHGNPRWCVSLGLLVNQRPELAIIYAPQTDEFYTARRDGGAFRNGAALKVSTAETIKTAPLVEVGASSRRSIEDYLGTVRNLMTDGIETRRGGSGALGIAQVATGEIDGYFEHHINSWDVAAGLLIVSEAGGRVSDFFAGDGLRSGNPVLACAPAIADRLVASIGFKAALI